MFTFIPIISANVAESKQIKQFSIMSKQVKKPTRDVEAFIADDVISSGSSLYLKMVKGDNPIRIITKPIIGWLTWEDKHPVRSQIDEEPEAIDEENKPKKFMAMAVIDRNDENKVKILELTQQSVIKAIKSLAENKDWGAPFTYDICINKTGEDLKTKYSITPSPKKALAKDVINSAMSKPCNLDALYKGTDPWDADEDQTTYVLK